MRQGQQSRRGRNRGSGGGNGGGSNGGGNRKPQNSLNRSYESSGPDVKIRGTAMHIADKYASLARDAMASGDIIMAENYLQHAEHYNRIIMAAQVQNTGVPGENGAAFNGNHGRFPQQDHFARDFDQDSGEDSDNDDFAPPRAHHEQPRYNQHQQPQPYIAQPTFPHAHPQHPAHNGVMNGSAEQPAVGEGGFVEGDRAPRRRRRRPPIAEGGRTYNGRAHGANGGGHQPVVFGAPDGDMPSGDESIV